MKCPHLTGGTCSVCEDLGEAVVLLESLGDRLREAPRGAAPLLRRVDDFLVRVEKEHP